MEHYDLVVVGSSWAGIYAAKSAVLLQARVALVTQNESKYLPNDTLFTASLGEIGRIRENCSRCLSTLKLEVNASGKEISNWVKGSKNTVESLDSLASLAALGVDIIVGRGEFYRLPRLGLKVNHRNLRSRNFLLATGVNFSLGFLDENTPKNYLTLRDLIDFNLENLPHNLIIVGSNPTALELTQVLGRLGHKITLVIKHSRLLPQEDPDLSILIQAQLEAEGIEIFTNSAISQIKTIDGQKWLQAGDRALTAAEIIIADYRQPNIAGLNLAGVDVKYDKQRVNVNRQLQTTNPNIYACGELIGGYGLPNIARYEVNLILKNTLFFPWYKTNYQAVPWAILTQPNMARVGLSETQAQQQCSTKVYVIKEYFSELAQAQIIDRLTGYLKLLVDCKGTILGCSIVGNRAGELITIPALMMQHKIKLDSNPMRGLTSISIPVIYPGMTEILEKASHNFYLQKIQQNPRLINRLKTWFSSRQSN